MQGSGRTSSQSHRVGAGHSASMGPRSCGSGPGCERSPRMRKVTSSACVFVHRKRLADRRAHPVAVPGGAERGEAVARAWTLERGERRLHALGNRLRSTRLPHFELTADEPGCARPARHARGDGGFGGDAPRTVDADLAHSRLQAAHRLDERRLRVPVADPEPGARDDDAHQHPAQHHASYLVPHRVSCHRERPSAKEEATHPPTTVTTCALLCYAPRVGSAGSTLSCLVSSTGG